MTVLGSSRSPDSTLQPCDTRQGRERVREQWRGLTLRVRELSAGFASDGSSHRDAYASSAAAAAVSQDGDLGGKDRCCHVST
jgi:hypothetical protein